MHCEMRFLYCTIFRYGGVGGPKNLANTPKSGRRSIGSGVKKSAETKKTMLKTSASCPNVSEPPKKTSLVRKTSLKLKPKPTGDAKNAKAQVPLELFILIF